MSNGTKTLSQMLDYVAGSSISPSEQVIEPIGAAFGPLVVAPPSEQGEVKADVHRQSTGVSFLLGEGTTLAGVAKYFLGLLNPAPGWVAPLTTLQYQAVGRMLFDFAAKVTFGSVALPSPVLFNDASMAKYWATGTIFPVPALIAESAGGPRLIVDIAALETVARSAVPAIEWYFLTRARVGSLREFNPFETPSPYESTQPDPRALITHRQAVVVDFKSDQAAGRAQWTGRFRWNPYAAALPLIHLLGTLGEPDHVKALIEALFDSAAMTAHELEGIQKTSAGHAVLRVAFLNAQKTSVTATTVARIANALGVQANTDLRVSHVTGPNWEPPLPPSANLSAKRKPGLEFSRSFLGRRVAMKWGTYKQDSGAIYEGPSSPGFVYPGQYFEHPASEWPAGDDRRELMKVGNAAGTADLTEQQLTDRLAVIAAIAFDIEGYADAIRAVDRALVSVGMQQFSYHVEEEGTVLFWRIRALSDTWFDVFFRSAGFEVGAAPKNKKDNQDVDVNIEALQKADAKTIAPTLDSPEASSAESRDSFKEKAWLIRLYRDGKPKWCVPGTVRVASALPRILGEPAESKERHIDCHEAFGFKETTAGPVTEDILARWAVAARLVPEVIRAQLEIAVYRFNRLIQWADKEVTVKTNGAFEKHTRWSFAFAGSSLDASKGLQQVFSSPAHSAALIDCFINTPVHTLGAARRAYERAWAGWQEEKQVSEPADLADAIFRHRLLLAFLSERRHYTADLLSLKKDQAVPVDRFYRRAGTNNVAPNRIARILDRFGELIRFELSKELGPRNLRSMTNFTW